MESNVEELKQMENENPTVGPQVPTQEENLTPEQRAARLEAEEDEYFEQMMQAFKNAPPEEGDPIDDEEYWNSHPLTCKELTPEMLNRPEF